MARTITNPANSSSLTSSVVRSELQTLEDEIANITSGHRHDGSDARQLILGTPGNVAASSSQGSSNGKYAASDHTHGIDTTIQKDIWRSGDWLVSSNTGAPTGFTDVSATYSNRFIRISSGTPLDTAGTDTHTHTGGSFTTGSHSHTGSTNAASAATGGGGAGANTTELAHTHGINAEGGLAVSGTSASGNNVPAYVQIRIYQR